MPEYWDPGQLLQIEWYTACYGSIQYLGRAASRNNARCRWAKTLKDDKSVVMEIYEILEYIARKPPSQITQQDLKHLAELCLCRQYYLDQRDDIVEHRVEVLKKAATYSSTSKGSEQAKECTKHWPYSRSLEIAWTK